MDYQNLVKNMDTLHPIDRSHENICPLLEQTLLLSPLAVKSRGRHRSHTDPRVHSSRSTQRNSLTQCTLDTNSFRQMSDAWRPVPLSGDSESLAAPSTTSQFARRQITEWLAGHNVPCWPMSAVTDACLARKLSGRNLPSRPMEHHRRFDPFRTYRVTHRG